MTLPQLKVGQIWQCSKQKHKVRVSRIEGNQFWCCYWQDVTNHWGDEYRNPSNIVEQDGSYPPPCIVSPDYALKVLLYDPTCA